MASGINRITRTAGAIATALLALSGQTPTALAARTEPMIAPDGTHYADLIIQQAADYDDFYNGVLGMPLSTGEISSAELAGVNLGFNYFWDMIGDSFKAQKPVQILVSTENASSANASAFSPSHQSITELAAAWSGDENVSDIAAGLCITHLPSDFPWYTGPLTVLPDQGANMHLSSTIVHELTHAFGLGFNANTDNSGKFWCSAAENSAFAYRLHDAYKKNLGNLLNNAPDGIVDIVELDLSGGTDSQSHNDDVFHAYKYPIYSGIYFSGKHVAEVLNGAEIAWPTDVSGYYTDLSDELKAVAGLPVNGFEDNGYGSLYLDASHIELQNSLLSHQWFRNWAVPMEAELALLQDLGLEFDRKRYFGYSVYGSNLAIDNEQGYWDRSEDGSGWLEGKASHQAWGVGLHIYGSNNKLTQSADLLSDGSCGIGARIDGSQNDVTVASDTTIQADGDGGKGMLFSWGKNHSLTVEKGAKITADGANGIALAFDFGSNTLGDGYAYVGSYTSVEYDPYAQEWFQKIYVPDELKGPLASSVKVAGRLSGKLASIYISPNAYVKNIVIESGAEISGDIISLWDPDKSIYGTPHYGYEANESLVTTLTFGESDQIPSLQSSNSETPATEFNDDIVSNGSIAMRVASGELKMNGTATVSNVTIESGATLSGGAYNLIARDDAANSGCLVNNGSLVSTADNPVVIAGDYEQKSGASLTLSVSGGRFVPLAVTGSANFANTATVLASPVGGWHSDGWVTVDASSPLTTAAGGNPTSVNVAWSTSAELPSSPTLKITQSEQGYFVERAEHAYSQHVASDAADIGLIFDASASTLLSSAAQDFFAKLDWSDAGGSRINKAAHALDGKGVVDGIAAVLMLNRMAQDILSADSGAAVADGSFVWASPIGARAEILSASAVNFNAAGAAGGWVSRFQGSTVSVSIAAMDVNGDGENLTDLDARGLWVSGTLRQDLLNSNAFWEGILNLGYIEADETRCIAFDDYREPIKAAANFWTFGALIKAGVSLAVADSISLEPFAQLSGSMIYSPSYDESSGGVSALSVESETYRSLEAGIGVALQRSVSSGSLFWRMHASYGRELLSDAGTMTASFVNSDLKGSFDRTVDWDSRNRLRAGLTVGIENESGMSVRGRIEGCRESADTRALAGSVEVQWRF